MLPTSIDGGLASRRTPSTPPGAAEKRASDQTRQGVRSNPPGRAKPAPDSRSPQSAGTGRFPSGAAVTGTVHALTPELLIHQRRTMAQSFPVVSRVEPVVGKAVSGRESAERGTVQTRSPARQAAGSPASSTGASSLSLLDVWGLYRPGPCFGPGSMSTSRRRRLTRHSRYGCSSRSVRASHAPRLERAARRAALVRVGCILIGRSDAHAPRLRGLRVGRRMSDMMRASGISSRGVRSRPARSSRCPERA
jgi:hypothetical protein